MDVNSLISDAINLWKSQVEEENATEEDVASEEYEQEEQPVESKETPSVETDGDKPFEMPQEESLETDLPEKDENQPLETGQIDQPAETEQDVTEETEETEPEDAPVTDDQSEELPDEAPLETEDAEFEDSPPAPQSPALRIRDRPLTQDEQRESFDEILPVDEARNLNVQIVGGAEQDASGPSLGPDFLAELSSSLSPQFGELKQQIVANLQDSIDRESMIIDAMGLG